MKTVDNRGSLVKQDGCGICESNVNQYCPTCLNCGGRYLRAIKARRMPTDAKVAWLRKALADWMAHKHPEAKLRFLAGGR